MSISAVTGTTASNSTAGTSLACPGFSATGADDLLVAVALASTSATVSSITDTAGNAYTQKAAINGTGVRVELWQSQAITGNASNVITVTASASSLIAIAVEEYRGAADTTFTPLARTGWTCTASSNVYGNAGQPTGAVGGTNGPWITSPSPQWIAVDMGSSQTFSRFNLTPNQSNAVVYTYTLDVSDDGSTWTSTGESSPTFANIVQLQNWALSKSYTHRYFRLNTVTDNGFVSLVSIYAGTSLAQIPPQNTGTNTGDSSYPLVGVVTQDVNNVVVGALAFACQSGDTFNTDNASIRQSVVPSLTSVGVALADILQPGVGTANPEVRLSAVREWAGAGLEMRTNQGATNYEDYLGPLLTATVSGPGIDVSSVYSSVPQFVTSGSGSKPAVSGEELLDGIIGASYTENFQAQGGTAPYTWSVISGNLPSGLTLNTSTGNLTGVPNTAGTYTFTVQAKDATGSTGVATFQIVVAAPTTGAGNYGFVA